MSTHRERSDVGAELIRAGKAETVPHIKGEDYYICKMVSLAMLCMYPEGGVCFDQVAIAAAYESSPPRYPITLEVGQAKPKNVMPARELMRTWTIQGRFGKLSEELQHMSVKRSADDLPTLRGIVNYTAEFQAYFHSYALGWEPGMAWITVVERGSPEPITSVIGFSNEILIQDGTRVHRPTMELITEPLNP